MTKKNWQSRLLPFILISYSILAIGYGWFFFFEIRSMQQDFGPAETPTFVQSRYDTAGINSEPAKLELIKWRDRVSLEQTAFTFRYHQGKLLILARLKLILFSFALGSITFLIGSIFILSRISEATSELGLNSDVLKAEIKSGSPGIVLSTLGTIIMLTCILVKADVDIKDQPLYIPYSLDAIPSVDTLNKSIINGKDFNGEKSLPKKLNDSINNLLKK